MVDSHVENSSDKIVNTLSNDCLDFSKLKEYITSESIVYNGIRMKWCSNYDSLEVFIESSCCQHGKSDFVAIWYPGKLNTLTFNGDVGKQVKECLIKLCTASPVGILENTDFNVGLDNLNLEIEILKSRVHSMQSLMNSQGSETTIE